MVRESELGRFGGQGRSQGRGLGKGRGYFNKISSSSSYKQEDLKFVTRSIKQVYNYTEVKDIIFQRVQNYYGYEVESSLQDLEEYDTEGEIHTIIMILETDLNTRDTNQIGL